MTDTELLVDFYKNVERQGPGGPAETIKALNLLGLPAGTKLNIADIGCGSGAQTLTLADNTQGDITAIDLFPQFLIKLKEKVRDRNLQNRVIVEKQSMDALQFEEGIFELIWSEGAIYIMGFERGIQEWSRFLKARGYLVLSEISWFTESRPKKLDEYWVSEYPQIDSVSNKIRIIEKNGYTPLAFFRLPDYCWTENYYRPIKKYIPEFLERYKYCEEVKVFVENIKKEIQLYENYKEYYGYGFYLAQKN